MQVEHLSGCSLGLFTHCSVRWLMINWYGINWTAAMYIKCQVGAL